MTLFRFDIFGRRKSAEDNSWDGMKPPGFSLLSLYYDLKWNYKLNQVDNLPLPTKLAFALLKTIQIIAYKKGWTAGGNPNHGK